MRLVVSPTPAKKGPWRKVHLDFHNSQHVTSVGEGFDADEFVATLRKAHVDSIVVFAKDMHGYCYYPSKIGPVHPGLARDLLGEQSEACRKAGIETYAYYCSLWDHYQAANHPGWLSIRRDGSNYLPQEGETPGWTALCASNEDLVRLIEGHVREILSGYDVGGVWFDMPVPRNSECFCPNCLAGVRALGEDPFDAAAQRRYQQRLHIGFLQRLYTLAQEIRPGCQVDFNNQAQFGLGERYPWMDSIDIEALPTAFWGYDFFPCVARYVRTFPRAAYGMTGRFLRSWGDFGGLKTSHQLTSEAFGILSLGTRCDIGDQMPPSGRLDLAVYDAIGAAYAEVEKLEGALEGMSSVAEAAIVVGGRPLEEVATPSTSGLVKLLSELNVQLDVVEADSDWQRYGLVILEDGSPDQSLALKLKEFLAGGGRALISGGPVFESAWREIVTGNLSKSEFDPSYAMLPGEGSNYEFAVYGESSSWLPTERDFVLSEEGVPLFQRSAERYTSHEQSPFQCRTGRMNASVRGNVGWIGFPVGKLYLGTGYWIYRELVKRALGFLLPKKLADSEYPGVIQVTVSARPDFQEFGIHVLDSSVARPSPGHPPFYAQGPARKDVKITLRLPVEASAARAVRSSQNLQIARGEDGRISVVLPELDRYELITINAATPTMP